MIMMMMPSTNSSSRSCLPKTLLVLVLALCGSVSAANNIGRIDSVADIEGVGVGADPIPTKKLVFASPTSSSAAAATPQDAPVIDRRRNNRALKEWNSRALKKEKKASYKVNRPKKNYDNVFEWTDTGSAKAAKAAEAESETDPAAEVEVKVLVDTAKTYIQLGSYVEAFEYSLMAIGRIGSGYYPNIEDIYFLLDATYLEAIQSNRNQLHKYKNMIAQLAEQDEIARSLLMKQIAKARDEIVRMSERYIWDLEARITLNTLNKKSAALYKMMGDSYVVIAGVQEGVHHTISVQNAEVAYDKAVRYASDLPSTDPICLGIAFSRYNFYLALNQLERAHTIAEVAVEDAAQTGLVHLPEVFQDTTCSAEEASRMISDPCTPCPLRLDDDQDDLDCCSVTKILACKMTESLHDYLHDGENGEVSLSIIPCRLELSIIYEVNLDHSVELKRIRHATFIHNHPHLTEDVLREKLEEVMSLELEGGVAVGSILQGVLRDDAFKYAADYPYLYNSIKRDSQDIGGVITTVIETSLLFSAPESELKEARATTPLKSSNAAWKYGVSGPSGYASGATIQVILFGALAESIAQTEIETIDVSLSNDLTFSVGQMHSPEAQNYFQGGIYWLAIPFSFATSLGLATTALMLPLNMNEAGSGLVPPAVTDDYLLGDAMNEEPSNFLRLGGLTIASGGVLPNIHTSSTSTLEAGRFPTLLSSGKDMQEKIDEVKGLNVAAPAASLTASSLGKQWQNIGQMYYIKSTMGPPQQIYF